VTTAIAPSAPLSAIDRCDRCGAQAYVRVTLSAGSELMFCAHHGRMYASKLREIDAQISDQSVRLEDSQPVA